GSLSARVTVRRIPLAHHLSLDLFEMQIEM
ncbi:hypothetical protein GCK32_022430, partial [Trichostrongylus colubriformis]